MTQIEFDLESKLLTVLEREARRTADRGLFSKTGAELLVVREPSVGATIPDLIVVRRRKRGLATGRLIALTESWVLGELMRTGELCEVTLTRKLYTPIESTREALVRLEKLGMVKRTPAGSFLVVSDLSKRFEVLAVEAKLTRWRAALEQAKTYLRFSDESFVALPRSVITRNDRIEKRCAAEGVGLIAVTSDDAVVILRPSTAPHQTGIDRREWTWVLAKTGALVL